MGSSNDKFRLLQHQTKFLIIPIRTKWLTMHDNFPFYYPYYDSFSPFSIVLRLNRLKLFSFNFYVFAFFLGGFSLGCQAQSNRSRFSKPAGRSTTQAGEYEFIFKYLYKTDKIWTFSIKPNLCSWCMIL